MRDARNPDLDDEEIRMAIMPPGYRPPPTPEQADAAAGYLLRAVTARRPRRPARWLPEPPDRPDNTPDGDLRAWMGQLCDARDRDRADVLGRDPMWQRHGY